MLLVRLTVASTGSVGQKPGRHLDHWVRGGIKTNAGPKDMCGFPRSRLAGSLVGTWAIRNAEGLRKRPDKRDARLPTGSVGQSMAGTWAVGHAEGLTQTPVRKRWQAPQCFGWAEAWPASGSLESQRDLGKRGTERYVMQPAKWPGVPANTSARAPILFRASSRFRFRLSHAAYE